MDKIQEYFLEKEMVYLTRWKTLPWKDVLAATGLIVTVNLCLILAFKGWTKVDKRCVQIHPDGSQQVVYEADCQK